MDSTRFPENSLETTPSSDEFRDDFSNVVIGEDLKRAIIALRSVPTLNSSSDCIYGLLSADNDSVSDTTGEYIWKAKDLEVSSRLPQFYAVADNVKLTQLCAQTASRPCVEFPFSAGDEINKSRRQRETNLTINGAGKHGAENTDATLSRQRVEPVALKQQSATAVRLSLLSRQRPVTDDDDVTVAQGSPGNRRQGARQATASGPADPGRGVKVMPPVPPKPVLYSRTVRNNSEEHRSDFGGKAKDPLIQIDRRTGGQMNGRNKTYGDTKTGVQTYTGNEFSDSEDVYERSMDILESDEFEEKDRGPSPRSNSPENLMEELLDSVPAQDFETMSAPYQESEFKTLDNTITSVSRPTNFRTPNGMLDKWKTGEQQVVEERGKNHVRYLGLKTFMVTGIRKTKLESNSKFLKPVSTEEGGKNCVSGKPIDLAITHPGGTFPGGNLPGGTRGILAADSFHSSSGLNSAPPPPRLVIPPQADFVHLSRADMDDGDLTPEDIFEKVMESLEISQESNRKSGEYDNGVFFEKLQTGSHQGKQLTKELRTSSAIDHSLENEWLSLYYNRTEAGMQICLGERPRNKNWTSETTPHAAPNPKFLSKSSTFPESLSVSGNCPLPASNTTSRMSQETIQRFVTKKPAPPLREKVQSRVSYARKDSFIYDFRVVPPPAPPAASARIPTPGTEINGEFLHVTPGSFPNNTSTKGVVDSNGVGSMRTRIQPVDQENQRFMKSSTGGNINPPSPPTKVVSKELETRTNNNIYSSRQDECVSERMGVNSRGRLGDNDDDGDDDDDVDLDLDAEFRKNLEVCTSSDVEYSGIDKLISAEVESSSRMLRATSGGRKNQKLEKKRLGVIIAKRKLQRAWHVIDDVDDSQPITVDHHPNDDCQQSTFQQSTYQVPPSRENINQRKTLEKNTSQQRTSDDSTSRQSTYEQSTCQQKPFQDRTSEQATSQQNTSRLITSQQGISQQSTYLQSTHQQFDQGAGAETQLDAKSGRGVFYEGWNAGFHERGDQFHSIDEQNRDVLAVANDHKISGNENRLVSGRKEVVTRTDTAEKDVVLSEEVTSQEIKLKIAWPKKDTPLRTIRSGGTPFRELQVQRILRISDLEDREVDPDRKAISGGEQPELLSLCKIGLKSDTIPDIIPVRVPAAQNNIRTASRLDNTRTSSRLDNTRTSSRLDSTQTVSPLNDSGIEVEYENQSDTHHLDHVAGSAIDVHQQESVKVLRVPASTEPKVKDIKSVVATVGSTILDEFGRSSGKSNFRVTCEAVETKSRSKSLLDEDVTVIRNTILDTLGSPRTTRHSLPPPPQHPL